MFGSWTSGLDEVEGKVDKLMQSIGNAKKLADHAAALQARGLPTDRFDIVRMIGEGGMGAVFEVIDKTTKKKLALKRLAALGGHNRLRFRREFLAISRLRHPNLVQVDEYIETPSGPCYTMELIQGVSFVKALEHSWVELVPAFQQMLDALAYIHRHRIVHRDIKPENVLLQGWIDGSSFDTCQVKLTDFGIAKDLGGMTAPALTAAGDLLGTVTYMSPEQALGAPVDGRSDLYALGVMLYYAVTKRFPLSERRLNAFQILVNKQRGRFTDPAEYVPRIPAELRELLCRLLAVQPSKRPSSAASVQRSLERCVAQTKKRGDAESSKAQRSTLGELSVAPTLPQDTPIAERMEAFANAFVLPSLAGREDELERLQSFAKNTQAAPIMWITGAAGMGKTALLSRWQRQRHNQGQLVVIANCEGAGDDASLLVNRLLRKMLEEANNEPAASDCGSSTQLAGSHLSALIRQHRGLLDRLAPEMAARATPLSGVRPPMRLAPNIHLEHRHLWRQVFELWIGLAGDSSLTVVVEDLQRSDDSQADLLSRFATFLRVEAEGLGPLASAAKKTRLVLTSRPIVAETPARTLATGLEQHRQLQRLDLSPLTQKASRQIAREYLGVTGSDDIAWLDTLVSKAAGVPLVLTYLLRSRFRPARISDNASAASAVPQRIAPGTEDKEPADGLSESDTIVDSDTSPPELATLLNSELERLGKTAHQILTRAAIFGICFRLQPLIDVAKTDEDSVLEVLDGAMRLGLIAEEENTIGHYCFSQVYAQEILVDSIQPNHRRVLHRKAAEALIDNAPKNKRLVEGCQTHGQRGQAAVVAGHFLASDEPSGAVPYLLKAGRESAAHGADQEAVASFRAALEQAGSELVDAQFAIDLGDALSGVGELEESIEWYQRAANLGDSDSKAATELRARSLLKAAVNARSLYRLDQASELARKTIATLGVRFPRSRLLARLAAFIGLPLLGRKFTHLEHRLSVLRCVAKHTHRRPSALLMEAMMHLTEIEVYRLVDLPQTVALHIAFLAKLSHCIDTDDEPYLAERLAFHAVGMTLVSHSKSSRRITNLALNLAERSPHHPAALQATGHAMWGLCLDGDMNAAVARGESVVKTLSCETSPRSTMIIFLALGFAYNFLGRFEEGLRISDEMRRAAEYLQDDQMMKLANLVQIDAGVFFNPTPALLKQIDRLLEESQQGSDRLVVSSITAFRPVAHFHTLGREAALDAIVNSDEIDFESFQSLARVSHGFNVVFLSDEIWNKGGLKALDESSNWLIKTARKNERQLTFLHRRVRLLKYFRHIHRAELAMIRGKYRAGQKHFARARASRLAVQSPYVRSFSDLRDAVWALRMGRPEAEGLFDAYRKLAEDNGWGTLVAVADRYLEEEGR